MTIHSPSISTAATIPTHGSDRSGHALLKEIGDFWRTFIKAAFDPYHPEQHYMRGPGPACAAKRRVNSY